MKKLLPVHRLLDAKTHVAYNKHCKENNFPQKHKADGREEMRLILSTLCKHIAQGMTDAPGGVEMKRLGYFFNWKCPRKMTFHLLKRGEGLEEKFNHHSNNYMYFPTFLPNVSKMSASSTWTMEKTFDQRVKDRVRDKVKEGFKYHNYLHTLKL